MTRLRRLRSDIVDHVETRTPGRLPTRPLCLRGSSFGLGFVPEDLSEFDQLTLIVVAIADIKPERIGGEAANALPLFDKPEYQSRQIQVDVRLNETQRTRFINIDTHARRIFLHWFFVITDDTAGTVELEYPKFDLDAFLRHGYRQCGVALAVEADQIDVKAREGWFVVVRGAAHHLDTEAERAPFINAGLEPWVEGVPAHFIRVNPTSIWGNRTRPA